MRLDTWNTISAMRCDDVTESSFSSRAANSADRADLGVLHFYAYTKRHFRQMPRNLKGKELLARNTILCSWKNYTRKMMQ